MNDVRTNAGAGGAPIWAGRVISLLVAALFIMSAVMKVRGGEEVAAGLQKLGIAESHLSTLAVLEFVCVALYLIPITSVTGAILLTGYLGGVILAHLRVGDPVAIPILLGVAVWVGVYLREPRIRSLTPFRIVHD